MLSRISNIHMYLHWDDTIQHVWPQNLSWPFQQYWDAIWDLVLFMIALRAINRLSTVRLYVHRFHPLSLRTHVVHYSDGMSYVHAAVIGVHMRQTSTSMNLEHLWCRPPCILQDQTLYHCTLSMEWISKHMMYGWSPNGIQGYDAEYGMHYLQDSWVIFVWHAACFWTNMVAQFIPSTVLLNW